MSKKVLVVGLEPEYNYPGDINLWNKHDTKYASNHGASLISRTLIKMFDADFAYDIDKPENYFGKYELCVVAFATHVTDWRDVSDYADFIEKLGIPTTAFSLGIQDYSAESGAVKSLHPSLLRIFDHVRNTTGYLGVRGFFTASLLYKEGYNNVIPIGCPTMFNGMKSDLKITVPKTFSTAVNVFHRTLANLDPALTTDVTVLGQDFLDEVVFTDNFPNDGLVNTELKKYAKHKYGEETLNNIKKTGVFNKTFDEWFANVGSSDFVFGPRLHGCISGIIQGKPAMMVARDIRVNEIADFYKIPKMRYEDYRGESVKQLYDSLDFTAFNELYPQRYDNFIEFMRLAGVLPYYLGEKTNGKLTFTFHDMQANRVAINSSIAQLQKRVDRLEKIQKNKKVKEKLKKSAIVRKVYKKLKG